MELRVAKLLKYLLYSVLGLFLLAVLVVGTTCENYDEAQGKYQKITITRIEDGKRVSYAGTQRDCL